MRKDELIREYVRMLVEDDAGGLVGATDAYPYGMQFGTGQDLYKIFVEPFTDVFKVAAGKGKELAVRTRTLGRTVLDSIASTMLPAVAGNYQRIFADEKKKIDALKREYQPVYDRVWSAFNHDDVRLLAFMYDPGPFLTYFSGKEGLKSAVDVLNVVSGGALDGLSKSLRSRSKQPEYKGGGRDVDDMGESVLREQEVPTSVSAAVKNAMGSSSAMAMRAEAQRTVQATLRSVLDQATKIIRAKSISALSGFPDDVEQQFNQLPASERTAIEKQALDASKASAREFFSKNLQGQLDAALKAGVPESSSYVRDYRATIEKIKDL